MQLRLISSRTLVLVALLGALPGGCTGTLAEPVDGGDVVDASGDAGDGGPSEAATPAEAAAPDAQPPFSCTLPAAAPTLKPKHWLHPTAPRAGQTVTLSLQSLIDPKPSKPHGLTITLDNSGGTRTITTYDVAGGTYWIYHIPVGDLRAGENCVTVRRGATVELALKVVAGSAQSATRGSGVWKVTRNHQWRCDEQPTYGNFLQVVVLDAAGQPVSGARVNLHPADDTVYPVKPDDTATSWAQHAHPKVLTTGTDGKASLTTPWGTGIRTPIDAKPSYLLFFLAVDGGASDTAMEITTGLWEANGDGCNYCGTYGVNVYGHWSYTVTFKRDPAATQVCDVPTDHAGQTACAHNHVYHDPARPSCQPVAP